MTHAAVYLRTLSPISAPVDDPLELDTETLAEIHRRCAELQAARDSAAVTAQSYIIRA